ALAMRYNALRDVLDESETVLPGLRDAMYPRPVFTDEEVAAQQANITRTENAQPAIGALSAGMIALLAQLGIVAEGAAGHSFGELVALYCAGVYTLPQLLTAARRRGVLMAEASGDAGTMIAVGASVKDLGELPEGVVLANHNAPDQVVLAGSTDAVGKAKAILEKRGLRVTPLQVATAFHSPLVAPAAEAFEKFLAEIGPVPEGKIPVWSNLTAGPLATSNLAEHLSKHLVSPVRWVEQVEAMYAAGFRSFVEVGPGSVLSGLVGRILAGRPHTVVAMDPRGSEGTDGLWGLLGRMVALGRPVDFAPLWADRMLAEPVVHSKVTVWINGANYGKPYPPADGKRAPANPPRQLAAAAPAVPPAPVQAAPAAKPSAAPVQKQPPSAGLPVSNGLAVPTASPVRAAAPAAGKGSGPHADRLNGTIRKDGGQMENRAPAAAWIVAIQESQRQLAQVQESFHRTLTEAHVAYLRAVEENSRALLGAMTGQALPA
ncbi:MAG TPA: acyltransferase domain-containing protein, partial [Myxococcota bacterium]|nr:acyltransferase domain-containing protein [Myxococcota bacterium]